VTEVEHDGSFEGGRVRVDWEPLSFADFSQSNLAVGTSGRRSQVGQHLAAEIKKARTAAADKLEEVLKKLH